MLDVGALTTSTPRAVAASTSTLSRPTPARATILSFGAAVSTSASTVVAERTSSASASGTAASSFFSVRAVHPTNLYLVTEGGDGRVGELVGDQYNGKTHPASVMGCT